MRKTTGIVFIVCLSFASLSNAQTSAVATTIATSIAREAVALARQNPSVVADDWQAQYERAVAHKNAGTLEVSLGMAITLIAGTAAASHRGRSLALPLLTLSGVGLTTFGAMQWFRANADVKTLRIQHQQP